MKIIKRFQLVNWHYFTTQTIPLGMINFLTGKNGTGKTTIIDAIQLVFLGDTAGHFFNKSATEKSSRTLNGYLRCETGDDDDGNPIYKRKGRFSCYVASELYDDEKNEFLTIGCVFDCFDDASYNARFFSYNEAFPSDLFVKDKIPVEIKKLREYIFEQYPLANFNFFETNTSYRDFIRSEFGDIGPNFFSLFKKAIPFAPITNIEQFITDYVCDVQSNIDISAMQENIRNYTQLELEATNLKARIEKLDNICTIYNQLDQQRKDLAVKLYCKNRAQQYIKAKHVDSLKHKLDDLQEDLIDNKEILEVCRNKIKTLETQKERLITERATSNDFQQKQLIQQQIDEIQGKIKDLQDRLDFVAQSLLNNKTRWLATLEKIGTNLRSLDFPEVKAALMDVKLEFINLDLSEEGIVNLTEKQLKALQGKINAFKDLINDNYRRYRNEASEIQREIEDINYEISNLNMGQKSYDKKLILLRDLIQETLSNKYDKEVTVSILADLLEVKHEIWRRPIESYLGPQRFYLFVEPQYVDEAIAIYDSNKEEYGLSDIGIVDTDKIAQQNVKVEPKSLAEEITTSNKYARKFIDRLLGTLIKCDDLADLRKNPRSITSSGMIYQNFVARQMNLERVVPFLGKNASNSILKTKNAELRVLKEKLNDTNNLLANFEIANGLELISSNEIINITNTINSCSEITNLNRDYDSYLYKLENVGSKDYYAKVEKDLQDVELQLANLRAEEENFISIITKCTQEIDEINNVTLPVAETSLKEITDFMDVQFKDVGVKAQGEALFLDELAIYKNANNIFSNYSQQLDLVENQINNLSTKVISNRLTYVTEYKLDYDVNDISTNETYQNELELLRDNKLVEYISKIENAKQLAMAQFKDNFLAKLKSNFDTIQMQIDNLNYALANSRFGTDSYCFKISPRRDYTSYYEMINDPLLLEGNDIFSEAFLEKYEDVINELFSMITYVDYLSNDISSEMEQNIAKFTDYRTYLKFDLLVTDPEGKVQHLSKTLLKKSGGETQTPFYISILASFAQLYGIVGSQKNTKSIRLIVFDEAFSKMDSERIQESVKLLRNYGLQAIISAPPEKMTDIVPLVDKTLTTVRQNTKSIVYDYEKISYDDNVKSA